MDEPRQLQFVSIERVSLIAVVDKPLSALRLAVFVGGYNFCHSWKRGSGFRNRFPQVDQKVTLGSRRIIAADGYR